MNREGLLHISRICDQRVEQVEDVLSVGQEVWVKVRKSGKSPRDGALDSPHGAAEMAEEKHG